MSSRPVEDEDDPPMPPGIEATMELLREGIDRETLVVLRQRMDDGGPQIVYDLVVTRRVSDEDVNIISIARLFPQQLREEELGPATEASERLH